MCNLAIATLMVSILLNIYLTIRKPKRDDSLKYVDSVKLIKGLKKK